MSLVYTVGPVISIFFISIGYHSLIMLLLTLFLRHPDISFFSSWKWNQSNLFSWTFISSLCRVRYPSFAYFIVFCVFFCRTMYSTSFHLCFLLSSTRIISYVIHKFFFWVLWFTRSLVYYISIFLQIFPLYSRDMYDYMYNNIFMASVTFKIFADFWVFKKICIYIIVLTLFHPYWVLVSIINEDIVYLIHDYAWELPENAEVNCYH